MRPILTPAEAAELDRATQARGVPAESLMERAGEAVARAAVDAAGGVYGRRAVVICGKGNNGGDGFVAARHLARIGLRVTVLVVEAPEALPEGLREPAATNFRRLQEVDVVVRPFTSSVAARELARADVAIDAVFGTGFRGSPEDEFAAAIEALNDGRAPVVAVDIPSGVNGTTAEVAGPAVWADTTVTFGAHKPGTVLLPGADRAGFVEVAGIGFPEDQIHAEVGLVEASDVAGLLPVREPDAHKRASGVVLAVGGSRHMTGAMRLVASAAYRAGAGLVTVAVPGSALEAIRIGLPEATFLSLPETAAGTIAPDAMESLEDVLEAFDAVAIGPGMGRDDETVRFVRSFAVSCPVRMVIDADALNAFEGVAEELNARRADAVLTPHAGEFARLTGIPAGELVEDCIGHVRKLAVATGATVLLKGSRTLIAAPEGGVRVTSTGTPALATAGSGDVLTGTIAALSARGLSPPDAATAGAYLHGVAGRMAGLDAGEGTVAGDVVGRLPHARREILRSSRGGAG